MSITKVWLAYICVYPEDTGAGTFHDLLDVEVVAVVREHLQIR